MISAFGVDHGISKSLVGGVFKPASALSRSERKAVGGYKKLRGVSQEHAEYKAESATRHRMLGGKPSEDVKFGAKHAPLGADAQGVTYRLGSAKQGRSVVSVRAKNKETGKMVLGHERLHAAPKRSEYRLHGQIIKDPVKTMREEARADVLSSGGHYNKQAKQYRRRKPVSVYAGSAITGQPKHLQRAYPHISDKQAKEGIKAYRKTQDQIVRAKGIKTPKERKGFRAMPHDQQIAAGALGIGGITAAGGLTHHYTKKPKKAPNA